MGINIHILVILTTFGFIIYLPTTEQIKMVKIVHPKRKSSRAVYDFNFLIAFSAHSLSSTT